METGELGRMLISGENDRTMQTCFREYPDVYGSELELEDDDDDSSSPLDEESVPSPSPSPTLSPTDPTEASIIPAAATSATPEPPSTIASSLDASTSDTERARAATQQVERDHGNVADRSDTLMVPKAAHDATTAGK